MKQFHFIISLLLQIIFFSSCDRNENACPSQDINVNISYAFKIDSVSNNWFAFNGFNYVELRSPEGQIFKLGLIKNSGLEYAYLADYDSITNGNCHFRKIYGAKGEYKQLIADKTNSGAPFEIFLKLKKNMYGQFSRNDDIKTMETASDIISFSLLGVGGNSDFLVKDLKTYTKLSKVFYDSTYNNVITVKGDGYYLGEMYLQENVGVIGFKFINGNPWMIRYKL